MSLDRFDMISKYLHFYDSNKENEFEGPKRLVKIYNVVEQLNKKFKSSYELGQDVSIDESLTLWKGKLSFRQYIPLKASKFGKTFKLYECASGFTWSFLVYTGKGTVFDCHLLSPHCNKSSAIVTTHLEPILGRGHTVWMDNWYNCPSLSLLLKNNKQTLVAP